MKTYWSSHLVMELRWVKIGLLEAIGGSESAIESEYQHLTDDK
jgi:hypothetical protein